MAATVKQADCVVVGGGAMGSAVAWQLARRGLEVVLLEQFAPGHDRGSSHGSSRIVRLTYSDPFYVELVAAAYDQWHELEDETGRQLLTWTGVVDHGDPATVRALSAALDAGSHQIELLDPAEAAERWPGLRFDGAVLFHQRGGRVHADHTVLALQEAAARHGAEIRHGTRVEAIAHVADGVEVRTAAEIVQARQAVVAAGAWTSRLLADQVALPTLTVTREQPAHFAPRDPAIAWPSAIHHQADAATRSGASPRGAFTLGCPDGVKVGIHAVGPVVDPESVTGVPGGGHAAPPPGLRRRVDTRSRCVRRRAGAMPLHLDRQLRLRDRPGRRRHDRRRVLRTRLQVHPGDRTDRGRAGRRSWASAGEIPPGPLI
jgi:sarcosine oxidase